MSTRRCWGVPMPLSDWDDLATIATIATKPPPDPSVVATVASVASVATLPGHRESTHEERAELRALLAVHTVGWPAEEQAEALAVALADIESALICWREIARQNAEAGRRA